MKRLITSLLALAAFLQPILIFAQIGHGGEPLSFAKSGLLSKDVDIIQLAKPDMAAIEAEDALFQKNGQLYTVGRMLNVDVDINSAGTWDFLPDGRKVWRLGILAQDAKALAVYYDNFHLPNGCALFLYNQNRKQVIGGFDYRNNPKFGNDFSTQMIEGAITWMELVIDANVTEMPTIEISRVSYIYRSVESYVAQYSDTKAPNFGASGSCEVNVNCPEGANWQAQKRGVAVIMVVDGWQTGFCTGTLVNNTANDGTPYFLTADHCGGGSTTINQWQFYFNFEAPACTNPGAAPTYNTITGATLKARGNENTGSDFLLLELSTTENELGTINAYYNGWDRSTTASPSGVGIHHPSGDIKKISAYTAALTSASWGGQNPANAFWRANWVQTQTNFGVTEGGSSGSPLFNNNKLVVGTLTGGASGCGNPAQNQYDLYGKFDYHWESNGAANNVRLKPWLDPQNTGATTVQGREPNGATQTLNAQFVGNPTTVAVGGNVAFTDQSTGNPSSWQWTFPGGNPASSTNQNPTINYATAGVYNVTLKVFNGPDNDVEVKNGYITVSDQVPLQLDAAFQASSYNIFEGGCVNFQDQSTGNPTSWSWNFQGAVTPTSTQQNPTNICWNTAGTYNVSLTVTNAAGETNTENCVGCITVTVAPLLPIAEFSGSPLIIPVGGVVYFTNLSQNGPFDAYSWSFEGGIPAVSNDETPQPITYSQVGTYDVELRVRNTAGVQDLEKKVDYVKVIPSAVEPPIANFTANYTVIQPGDAVNFIDLSSNYPYQWEWIIQGGTPASASVQNPQGVVFAMEGIYDVCLIVKNNHGTDTLCRDNYIVVSATDPCTDAPVAKFTAAPRLITQGQRVFYQDQSTNLPQHWNWIFQGGNPSTSTEGSITGGVLYSVPGIYNVTLAVSNACGNNLLTKDDYIYVFSGPVGLYCDTLTNLRPNEGVGKISAPAPYWGFVGGHNGKKIKVYADKFHDYTFGQIKSLIVPVEKAVWGAHNSYVRFRIWDGSNDSVGEVLGEKRVYIKDLQANYNNVITFEQPIQINGPFYVGYTINYPDADNDGFSDDLFVVSLASPRGAVESYNTLWLQDANVWKSNVAVFGFATSTGIKPIGCLVDIPEYMLEGKLNIYPNPANDFITLEFGEEFIGKDFRIQIRNILGSTILDMPITGIWDNIVIPTSSYPEGMYLVTVVVNGKILTKRVSIMR